LGKDTVKTLTVQTHRHQSFDVLLWGILKRSAKRHQTQALGRSVGGVGRYNQSVEQFKDVRQMQNFRLSAVPVSLVLAAGLCLSRLLNNPKDITVQVGHPEKIYSEAKEEAVNAGAWDKAIGITTKNWKVGPRARHFGSTSPDRQGLCPVQNG
jgi:hypothetical protein